MQEVTEVYSLTKPIRFLSLTPLCMHVVCKWLDWHISYNSLAEPMFLEV